MVLAGGVDTLDPALTYTVDGWAILDTTCARLMAYPDKPSPQGLRLMPEVAATYPAASRNRRTWTFRLRSGFRFSNGKPVRASAFARAIYRTLAPGITTAAAQYTRDIVGAKDVQAGKTTAVAGVRASGNRLVIRLNRAVPDFPARTTMPFFCAVPPDLPPDAEGRAVIPSAGPYLVSEYRPRQRAVIERNPFYGGKRPHHVTRFVVDLGASSHEQVLDRIEAGTADWGSASPSAFANPDRRLAKKYGINGPQFYVRPGLRLRAFALNTSRRLFRNNPKLRQAVNFAVNRRAIRSQTLGLLGSTLTDQYLPRGIPGFADAPIYPLNGPALRKAKSLARGHTRSGKAVLYTFDAPQTLAIAQIVRQNLAKIGIDVDVKGIPTAAYYSRLTTPNEAYDIAFSLFVPDYPDPFGIINLLLDGQFIGTVNYSRFDSPKYNQLLRKAALLRGPARYRAYGKLDVQVARDAAPMIAVDNLNELTLVSKRVGCVVLRPAIDLTAVCLK